jgi:UPF0716 protein FxsA
VLARLLILFIVVPLAELTLLLILSNVVSQQFGPFTGVFFTLALVVMTGIAGTLLAHWQGWRTLQRIRRELAEGRMPGDALLDGVLIFVAGALLLTPGVLTDALGILLLVPVTRGVFKRRLIDWFRSRFRLEPTEGGFRATAGGDRIIDSHVVRGESSET